MKSATPKVLHKIMGKAVVSYAVDAVRGFCDKTVVVIGPHSEAVKDIYKVCKPAVKENKHGKDDSGVKDDKHGGILFAYQEKPLGTANALMDGLKGFKADDSRHVLVVTGDAPLIEPESLKKLIRRHEKNKNDLTVLSFDASDPTSYGRILRGEDDGVLGIIEEKDASAKEKLITEVNSGIYLIAPSALKLMDKIKLNAKKGEYYLTDLVSICVGLGLKVDAFPADDEEQFMGINSRRELLIAQKTLQWRINNRWLDKGVTLMDIESIIIGPDVKIGADTVVYPNVVVEGETRIGKNCTIYPNARIVDSSVGDNVTIKDSTLIENSTLQESSSVGPFSHLRPGSRVGPGAKIGNFVELKNTTIGRGSKAMHLSYLGDATLGEDVNIGAGTITCNYDGVNKHRTVIKDGVFIGSDSQLIAPVTINKGAYVGAGSTITSDVAAESLAISRTKQINLPGWAKTRRKD
jgi:bifunctional UDP-N-acetylglucosamine pyrophosphorylase/glucosamine-1-phosphate N-acetyltransferase